MKIERSTIHVQMSGSEEGMWKKVHKKNRWSVEKARKEGVTVRKAQKKDHDAIYSMYTEVMLRNGEKANSRKDVLGSGQLYVAEHEGVVVAFSCVRLGDIPVLRYNASSDAGRKTQANALLYWEVMLDYKEQGYQLFDLGGIDPTAAHRRANDRFKERWGGEIVEVQEEVGVLAYVWWKYLRHISLLRRLKP